MSNIKTEEPASKKRKVEPLDGGSALPQRTVSSTQWLHAPYTLQVPEVSFSTPIRKKLTVEFVADHDGGIRGIDPKTGSVEASMAWADIGASPLLTLLFPSRA